jgi:hypothetical protein
VILKLTCLDRTVTGRGKHRDVRETIVWQEEYTVSEGQIGFGPMGTSIPVHFALPADARATTASGRGTGIFWVLTADASLPGVDFVEDFEVPVAATAAASGSEPTFNRPAGVSSAPVSVADLAASGVIVSVTSEGTECRFQAGRNTRAATSLTVFVLIWTGALWLQFVLDFPWIFIVVTGFFELILLLIVANLWFGSTTVTIGGGSIRRRHAIVGLGSTRVIPVQSISRLDLHIGMQSTGPRGTPYYDLRVTLAGGRRTHLGSSIRNKRHAEWLRAAMSREMGI